MNKTLIALVPVALILMSWTSPAFGQDAPAAAPEQVVRELAGIQASLDDLVTLLSTMRRNQDADLILRRIEMHERRLAPIEQRLDSNKREQLEAEEGIGNVREWMQQTEEAIREIEREGDEVPIEARREATMGESELQRLTLRLETLRLQQIELENSLLDGHDEVEILDDLLEELLN